MSLIAEDEGKKDDAWGIYVKDEERKHKDVDSVIAKEAIVNDGDVEEAEDRCKDKGIAWYDDPKDLKASFAFQKLNLA